MSVCVCGSMGVSAAKNEHLQCAKCGTWRKRNVNAAKIYAMYADGNYHTDETRNTPYPKRYDHDIRVGHTRLDTHMKRLHWLDVGGANGGFATAANQRGFTAHTFEPSTEMCQLIKDRGEVAFNTWAQVPYDYDVASLHDVLEHAVDPAELLQHVTARLRSGGLLIIDVPDVDGNPFRSHHYKPKEHLWYFTLPAIAQLLYTEYGEIEHEVPIPGKLVVYARKR